MEHRWAFLAPWCASLKGRLLRSDLQRSRDIWNVSQHTLELDLPSRRQFSDTTEFQAELQKIRETLALLAAVKYVDPPAWKFLLTTQYGNLVGAEEEFRPFEEDIPACFLVDLGYRKQSRQHNQELMKDLVTICGSQQRENTSPQFVETMQKIAAFDSSLTRKEGVEINVPIRVVAPLTEDEHGLPHSLFTLQNAEEIVQQQWETYEAESTAQLVAFGSIRSTLVLEPMAVEVSVVNEEIALVMEEMARSNVRMSHVEINMRASMQFVYAESSARRKTLSRLMASVFDSSRRQQEEADTRYCSRTGTSYPYLSSSPRQLDGVRVNFDFLARDSDFEALCSAVAFSQITRKLSFGMRIASHDEHRWKWLAYALFSKRARANSVVELLSLGPIDSLSTANMESFLAVLESDHPEEELLGCPRGDIDDRDATIKPDARIRWPTGVQGGPISLALEEPIPLLRTFSDDGVSEWVDAMIPGYGHCQVVREDLAFHSSRQSASVSCSLASLTIGLSWGLEPDFTGLPTFLSAVGSSLKFLAIQNIEDLNENALLQSCPNLEELSLSWHLIHARLNFSEYHKNKQPLPKLNTNWKDVVVFVNQLGDLNSPLAKCARKLRLRINPSDDPDYNAASDALLSMLKANRNLEYLEILVPSQNRLPVAEILEHHDTPIGRSKLPLPLESKLAFLGVLTRLVVENERYCETLRPDNMDQHVLLIIFTFAGTPVTRKVYVREFKPMELELGGPRDVI